MTEQLFPDLTDTGTPQPFPGGGTFGGRGFRFTPLVDGITALGVHWWSDDDVPGDSARAHFFEAATNTRVAFSGWSPQVTGWNEVLFGTPFVLTVGTEYIVSIYTNASATFSVAPGALPVDNANFDMAPNAGVYRIGSTSYDPGSFPTTDDWYGVELFYDGPEVGGGGDDPAFVATLWDGSTEGPVTITAWDGSVEQSTTLEVTN